MLSVLKQFLDKEWNQKSPLLVGVSGGPDSMALLHGLLEWGKAEIHVAHVNHGWREESEEEERVLRERVKELGCLFHGVKLEKEAEGNWEEKARERRLEFFFSLFEKIPFQALLLGHQRDDLAETALKRVLEGAHLPFLGGMAPITGFCGKAAMMKSRSSHLANAFTKWELRDFDERFRSKPMIWRPLLGVTRRDILAFLQKRNLPFFDDPTNRDPRFLRSRMRAHLLPLLDQTFGKNTAENLSLLSERAFELKHYLNRKTSSHPILHGPWGICFEIHSLERIEARHLLQKFASFPRRKLEQILEGKLFREPTLVAERGWVFLLNNSPPHFGSPIFLQPGRFHSGDWEITVEETSTSLPPPDWKHVWSGHFAATLPSPDTLLLPSAGTPFKKLWSEKKVPFFLRFQVPVLSQREFLSGTRPPPHPPSLKISLRCLKPSAYKYLG